MSRRIPLLAGAVLALGLVAALRTASAGGFDFTGRMAPEIRLADGLNGASASTTLASLRGKVVCLKFWLTHCPICRGTLPEFQSIQDTYGSQGVVCLGVVIDSADGVRPYLREAGWTFPVGCDPDQASSNVYGVHHFPGDYLIGSDGIVKVSNGFPRTAIEQELRRTHEASDEPRKNAEELGALPAALSAARDVAAKNDYGAVLRLAEAHLDAAKDPADVVAAAKRIREVCRERWNRRVQKIRARWDSGDPRGAYADAVRFSEDFKDTSFFEATAKWARDLEAALRAGARPEVGGVSARSRGGPRDEHEERFPAPWPPRGVLSPRDRRPRGARRGERPDGPAGPRDPADRRAQRRDGLDHAGVAARQGRVPEVLADALPDLPRDAAAVPGTLRPLGPLGRRLPGHRDRHAGGRRSVPSGGGLDVRGRMRPRPGEQREVRRQALPRRLRHRDRRRRAREQRLPPGGHRGGTPEVPRGRARARPRLAPRDARRRREQRLRRGPASGRGCRARAGALEEVKVAVARLLEIARQREDNRLTRAEDRARAGRVAEARAQIEKVASDFRETSLEARARERLAALPTAPGK